MKKILLNALYWLVLLASIFIMLWTVVYDAQHAYFSPKGFFRK